MFTNNQIHKRKHKYGHRRPFGQAISEAGPVFWLLFIGLAFPAMCFASVAYRSVWLYFATRDACYKAAKSPNWTLAVQNANTTFTADLLNIPGIISPTETTDIIQQPLAGGDFTELVGPLGTIDTDTYAYFMKTQATANVEPLFTMGPSWLGISIPGLTGPFPLQVVARFFVENPQGLLN